jgi:hypothetical protein
MVGAEGGVSNVDIDGNNTLHVKAIGVVISTFETLPEHAAPRPVSREPLTQLAGRRQAS